MVRRAVAAAAAVGISAAGAGAQRVALLSHAAGLPDQAADEQVEVDSATPDGRWVSLSSLASDLVAGLANPTHSRYVALWDRDADSAILVSRAAGSTSTVAGGASFGARVSADGCCVAFQSLATDLVSGAADDNLATDVLLFDRVSGQAQVVSHAAGAPLITANGMSMLWAISTDGRYVLFSSMATNVVTGQIDSNGFPDLFLWDRLSDSSVLVSHVFGEPVTAASAGTGDAFASGDGRWVAFDSGSPDLVGGGVQQATALMGFLFDRDSGVVLLVSHVPAMPTTNANGFSTVHGMSADGSLVLMRSDATNLVAGGIDTNGEADVFAWVRATGEVELISRRPGVPQTAGDGWSEPVTVDAAGRFVAFRSTSTDLIAGGSDSNGTYDAFLFDRDSGAVLLASRSFADALATGDHLSDPVSVSGEGDVLFGSMASDLAPPGMDDNGNLDAYLWSRSSGRVLLVSRRHDGAGSGSAATMATTVSADGGEALLESFATDLVQPPQPPGHIYRAALPLFADGFETGDASGWTFPVP
ncbi:MAG: hypothetical protein F9K18_07050 [Thermoanaerobaculia bacterium]|nr:MAG: hypothetical protein F9K18_07050 [Thermoanaerobaculia bacterium]